MKVITTFLHYSRCHSTLQGEYTKELNTAKSDHLIDAVASKKIPENIYHIFLLTIVLDLGR